MLLVNNILRVDAGYGISVDANSQVGFQSNNNLLYRGPAANAFIGLWNGATQATLAAWQAASGKDANSQTGNPLLLDVDGADNILGEQGVSTGNGFDDNFELDAYSPAIDAGNAYLSPAKDIEGRDRRNDPDVADKGAGWDLFVPADQGASLFTAGGTAKNFRTQRRRLRAGPGLQLHVLRQDLHQDVGQRERLRPVRDRRGLRLLLRQRQHHRRAGEQRAHRSVVG